MSPAGSRLAARIARIPPGWALASAGLAATAVTLLACAYLPFQDVPNHVSVLSLDGRLRAGVSAPFVATAPVSLLGYSLLVVVGRALGPWLGAQAIVRVVCVACALGLPLATAALARLSGGSARWAAVLALPLAVSWPLRIGLLEYCLALPSVALGLGMVFASARRSGARPVVGLGVCALLGYLAHPYACAWLAILAIAACARLRRQGHGVLPRVALGLAAPLPLIARDLLSGGLGLIPGATSLRSPLWWRPPSVAAANALTRGLGLSGPLALALSALFVVVLVVACVRAVRRAAVASPAPPALALAAGVALVGAAAMPESFDNVFLLGSRAAVLAVVCAAALASPALAASAPLRVAAVAGVTLALGFQLHELAGRSALVREVAGERGPDRVDGALLPLQVPRCSAAGTLAWGDYDPLRHLWAYALGSRGVTPYLFASSRAQPVWFDDGALDGPLSAPPEYRLNDNEVWRDEPRCARMAQARLALAAGARGSFDGVLVTGRQPELGEALARSGLEVARTLAPGMVLLARPR